MNTGSFDSYPLILLHGPPGTGKTTLCQALAQKMSIRLTSTFSRTTHIQLNPATIFTRYYGESAQRMESVFHDIQQLCTEDRKHLICVHIDEVETIAGSRAADRGEVGDSTKSTNSLLMGIDRVRAEPNLLIICTSNLRSRLDSAFISRLSRDFELKAPTEAARYEILRGRLEQLMNDKIIDGPNLPIFRWAKLDRLSEPQRASSRLLNLVSTMNDSMAGRKLRMLPVIALEDRLRSETCTLDLAMTLIIEHVKASMADRPHEKAHPDECTGYREGYRDGWRDGKES